MRLRPVVYNIGAKRKSFRSCEERDTPQLKEMLTLLGDCPKAKNKSGTI